MQIRSPLVSGLALGIAVLVAPLASAEEPVRVAQTAPPDGGTAGEPPPRPQRPPPESSIEEIVVLGTESEAASDFAAGDSVTGFGAEDLAALGAQNIADIASFTPNLEIVTGGATTPTFFIRGVGLNDFNPTSTGAVSIYRDDVAINSQALQLGSLFDVESVNILRGPQGTGLARNASAGAIKLYSRKPSGDFGGYMRSDFGNFTYQDYEGAFEAPIYEDLLSGRFAFRLTERDGTMKNRCGGAPPFGQRQVYPGTGGGLVPTLGPWSICGEAVETNQVSPVPPGLAKEVNNLDNWAARGTLLFQPTLDMTWLVAGHGSRRDELTRLGQSIGTGGDFCIRGDICTQTRNVPPELVGEQVQGLLGGTVNGVSPGFDYQPREIRNRLIALSPCYRDNTCVRANGRFQDPAIRAGFNRAKVQLAQELAEGLDTAPWKGDFNRTGPTTNDTWGGYAKSNTVLPGAVELNTVSAYDAYDRFVDIDLDFSPETLFQIQTKDQAYQYYQDLSLKGQIGDGALSWEIGGWFLHEDLDVEVKNDFGELQALGVDGRVYNQKLWNAAGYFRFGLDFWDDFTLDGGVRYNWDTKHLDMDITGGQSVGQSNFILDQTWQAPTGTIRLTYHFRDDTSVSWKYTRGWKPGSFNATASQYRGPTVAEPEELDSFETNLSGSWLDGRFGLDSALFYYSYHNYQIFTAQQFFGGNPEFVILNAKDAEVYGAELDATARPWSTAFLEVRMSWLESRFLDFVQTDQSLGTGGGFQGTDIIFKTRDNSGNRLLNSPEFKISITAEQTIPLGRYGALVARYDGAWTAKTYYDASGGSGLPNQQNVTFMPNDTIAQIPYWVHNVRLTWRAPGGRLELAGWVRNLTNEAYKTFAFDGSTFRKTTIYFVGDPRTYGVSAVFNF